MKHRIFLSIFLILYSSKLAFSQSLNDPYRFQVNDTTLHWVRSGLDKELTGDVNLIGLGEFTHGGKEVFEVKTSLLKYLIYEQGFKSILFEFPNIALIPINDYIQDDKVFFKDLISNSVLSTLSSSFRTVEIIELIKMIKQYNMSHPNKVSLKGIDISPNIYPSTMHLIQRYLGKYYPEDALTFFNEKQAVSDSAAIVKIEKWIDRENFKLAPGFSRSQFDELKYDVKNAVDSYKTKGTKWHPFMRDSVMAENIKLFAKLQKTVIWAHNLHLVKSISSNYGKLNLGQHLDRSFGKSYYVILTDFYQKAELTIRKDDQGSPPSYISKKFMPQNKSFAKIHFKDSISTTNYFILGSKIKNQLSQTKLNLVDVVGTAFSVSQEKGRPLSWDALILLNAVTPSVRF